MRKDSRTDAPGGVSLVILLLIAGCGGGGGGGGTQALQYSGNTNQATISGTNASRLTANIFGSNEAAGIIVGTSIEGDNPASKAAGGMADVTRILSRAPLPALRRAIRAKDPGPVAGETINETEPCDGGNGSVRTTGTLSDTNGTGVLTVVFRNCLSGAIRLDGTATIRVLAVDFTFFIPTDFIVSSPRLTLRGGGVSADTGGSVQVQTTIVSFPQAVQTITNNLVSLNNVTDVMTKGENLVFVNQLNDINFPSAITMEIMGRIFDSVNGYVDVSTPVALAFSGLPQLFPDSGEISLTGNASSIIARALSSTRANLMLDFVGPADSNVFINWADLSGPLGVDLGDADGDGMHNSWETVHNTVNPGDDPDADGSENQAEYQAGSNPNSNASTPGNP